MTEKRDVSVLREQARRYAEAAADPVQDEKRALWRRHNSLKRTRPMVLCLWRCATKEIVEPQLQCEDPFYRQHERFLRSFVFTHGTGDDYVIEPWITQRASFVSPPRGLMPWGLPYPKRISPEEPGGAWRSIPPMQSLDDLDRMTIPVHAIDEEQTARNAARLHEAVGDILEVNLDRSPAYTNISQVLAELRGNERILWDMCDHPEWLHRLLKRLSDTVVRANETAEKNGDYRLGNHTDIPPSYEETLRPPRANGESVRRNELYAWFHAQEYAYVSPEMHDEFMLQYQIPFMEKFAMIHYGCCEDLTNKIDILRKVKNLRRIAVVPWADVARCAEQIGDDFVISWQPNPAEMGCCGFDPARIRRVVKEAMDKMRGCHVDVVLKDVQTVEGHPERMAEWTRIVREVTASY